MNRNKVNKFEELIGLVRQEKEIVRKSLQGFEVVARTVKFAGTLDLKKSLREKSSLSEVFNHYNQPYRYLRKLQEIDALDKASLYLAFVKIEYKILNKDGKELSGGERSEYNLLQQIEDAKKFEILLIDEPESSFDNLFLKNNVNELIKNISQTMPVVLSTHNNTVGASIDPNYLLYTKKENVGGEANYRIYSGSPASKKLRTPDGEEINTLDVTLDCLEAGPESYAERKRTYENLAD